MKYYLMVAFMAFSLSVNLTSCSPDDPIGETKQPETPNEPDDNNGNTDNPMNNNFKISIGCDAGKQCNSYGFQGIAPNDNRYVRNERQ